MRIKRENVSLVKLDYLKALLDNVELNRGWRIKLVEWLIWKEDIRLSLKSFVYISL